MKYYSVTLTKEQKDIVINALSRLRYVLPEDALYRGKVVAVLKHFEKLRPYKVGTVR